MGPVSTNWYKDNGLMDSDGNITQSYSCGRIDCRGESLGMYGDEIGLPPMKTEDWNEFSDWLFTVESETMLTLKELVELYEENHMPISFLKELT
jgi:hypothetical protein